MTAGRSKIAAYHNRFRVFEKYEISDQMKLALQMMNSGRLNHAEEICCRMLHTCEENTEALHMMGLISYRKGKVADAIAYVSKAIERNPRVAVYHYNSGYIYASTGDFGKAAEAYKKAILLYPNYAEALNNLGLILYDLNRVEESVAFFLQAIRSKPDFTNAYYNLGNARQALGAYQAALAAYGRVMQIIPDSAANRFNRSLALLVTGKFKEGWMEYEWRFQNSKDQLSRWHQKEVYRWDGSPFDGKRLLVLDEQGIGDTLQFIRYLPRVKALGGTVLFETIQPLMALLGNQGGIDVLLNRATAAGCASDIELYVPLMSLPGIFNTGLDSIPAKVPYVFPDPSKVDYWRRRLTKDAFKVGVVWAGRPTAHYKGARTSGLEHVDLKWAGTPANKIADSRSSSLSHFSPLAQVPGIHLYGLQKGESAWQVGELSQIIKVDNLGEEFRDFSDTAAVIANLDLVISVDTSVAHLAGAMGKPVWVLIPFAPDWRWMLGREDSPWYPTMRLFRQAQRGEWDEVFKRVARELYTLIHQ